MRVQCPIRIPVGTELFRIVAKHEVGERRSACEDGQFQLVILQNHGGPAVEVRSLGKRKERER
jgi:hypothetical protein